MTKEHALSLISAEFDRACRKFPTWQTDGIQAAAVVVEEAGELLKECNQMTFEPHKSSIDAVRDEAVQTGAMALRFLLSLDKYEFTPRDWHFQGEGQ